MSSQVSGFTESWHALDWLQAGLHDRLPEAGHLTPAFAMAAAAAADGRDALLAATGSLPAATGGRLVPALPRDPELAADAAAAVAAQVVADLAAVQGDAGYQAAAARAVQCAVAVRDYLAGPGRE